VVAQRREGRTLKPLEIQGAPMLDIILIAVGGAAFALAIAYAYACDGL